MAKKTTRKTASVKPKSKPKIKAKSPVLDYRHDATRKNIPPAGLAAQGKVMEQAKIKYQYNPHLPPKLRFDSTGGEDSLPELLETARIRPLNADETRLLADALRNHEPWLEWSGKQEKKGFTVDPVALHIHERVSAQAIIKIAEREDVQRSLFADTELEYRKAVQFYQHDVDWSNRLILGDSLEVMASLARRENLAGQVQMIYIDPPYGINYNSNFQSELNKRKIKDREVDLTRDIETVKAYRDTWTLGVHSYLSYLRDRFILSKELLKETGSIFVQISDENLHFIKNLLDEVFGPSNSIAVIRFRKKTMPLGATYLERMGDFLLWYTKDATRAKEKYKHIYTKQDYSEDFHWKNFELASGYRFSITKKQMEEGYKIPDGARRFRLVSLWPASFDPNGVFPVKYNGKEWWPAEGQCYPTSPEGMERLVKAEQIGIEGNYLRKILYSEGAEYAKITTDWGDTIGARDQSYVVETSPEVIQRCMLMSTDPGDLVLDPTCGSGTTAFAAEQWGRRWITIDTSRVAVSLSRQRLLTSSFEVYKVKQKNNQNEIQDNSINPINGFENQSILRSSLKSIIQNPNLDRILIQHDNNLKEKLNKLNETMKLVTQDLRKKLSQKLQEKEQRQGKKFVTELDRRRWQIPKDEWKEWEVPFDVDEEYPEVIKNAIVEYRYAWRNKMDEVNVCIAANADPVELVDQPERVSGVVRVSGPFTVEAVMPSEEMLVNESPIGGTPEEMETFESDAINEPINAEAYLDKMIRLMRNDGVRFPNNKIMHFERLDTMNGEYIHAEGVWANGDGKERRVAVSFGPQYGPITSYQVENALHSASKRGYDDIVFAGFSFDGSSQATIQDDPNPKVRCHLAHIRPDVSMGGLLKETANSQLFTVFGSPRTDLKKNDDELYIVTMEGVDIYNPVENTIVPTNAEKVAAWFLDTDYDGRTFCITQAFFPDKSAWKKLANALKGSINEEKFEALSGTESLPFPAGKNKRVAVKVIDPRGNEVMKVHRLGKKTY